MYGLKEAGKITQEILVKNLALYGYKPVSAQVKLVCEFLFSRTSIKSEKMIE